MKAKVEATALRGAVSALKRLGMCGPQESLLLDTPRDGTLVVQASAHHIAARINLPAECEETGQTEVNAAELSSLLAAFSGDPVDLEAGDRFVGVSSGERTRGRVRVVEPTSADLWATFDPQEYTTVLEGDFTRALSRVEPFCEKEPTRATHSVVVQDSEAAATNGYVLGVFPVEGKVPSPVQIPHPVAQRMAGLEVDRLAVHQEDGRLAWITGPDMEVLYAQPAGDFPNYQKVLADREGKADLVTLSGDLQEWREAVKRIARIADPVEFMRVGWEKAGARYGHFYALLSLRSGGSSVDPCGRGNRRDRRSRGVFQSSGESAVFPRGSRSRRSRVPAGLVR